MEKTQWRLVGKVKEAHGLKGDLYVLIFSGDSAWKNKIKSCALATPGSSEFQVLNVEKTKDFKSGFILKSKEFQTRNQSEAVKGKLFYISNDYFKSDAGDRIFLSEVLHFTVFDNGSKVGVISGFSSNGPQDLLVVDYQGKPVEIPFVEAFIQDIDFENQKILMQLPEGLLNLDED